MTDAASGLYIHIPFCRSKCPYCSFYSSPSTKLIPAYLKALGQEMDLCRPGFSTFDTVYIGGGTPSLLSLEELGAIMEGVTKKFRISSGAEITMEANPADLDHQSLAGLKQLGFNRLNIGVQSFDDKLLKFLGRRHNRHEAIEAIAAAQAAGFDNLGIDLIYGVPDQELPVWQETLQLALSFRPAHLSCYQLTLERSTPLHLRLLQDNLTLPDEEQCADFFFRTAATLQEAGYQHYEVSNFARDETACSRHNQKYWQHVPYLGLGPAAHSFQEDKRWWNKADLAQYLRDCGKGIAPVEAAESLTPDNLRLEALFLGLRTSRGIDLASFNNRYGCDLLAEKAGAIKQFIERGLLEINGVFLQPTPGGMAVADTLALM